MRNRAKFRADRSNHCRYIAIFEFLEWRPPYLEFLNLKFVTVQTVKMVELRNRTKFSRNR